MSDYNKYVTAVNKIFEVAAKLKVNYPNFIKILKIFVRN